MDGIRAGVMLERAWAIFLMVLALSLLFSLEAGLEKQHDRVADRILWETELWMEACDAGI